VPDPDAALDATEATCNAAQKGNDDGGELHSAGGDNHTGGADNKSADKKGD